jgi:hypothetical protein
MISVGFMGVLQLPHKWILITIQGVAALAALLIY